MSADNWTQCPKCQSAGSKSGTTLREDYEIGIRDGMFEVDYRAFCCDEGYGKHKTAFNNCGYKFHFAHRIAALKDPPNTAYAVFFIFVVGWVCDLAL